MHRMADPSVSQAVFLLGGPPLIGLGGIALELRGGLRPAEHLTGCEGGLSGRGKGSFEVVGEASTLEVR